MWQSFLLGPQAMDVLPLFARLIVGLFFVLARFRWFFDPSRPGACFWNSARHKHLAQRLCTCGYGMHPILSGFVAFVEVFAGLALIVGLLTNLAAVGLLGILAVGTYCTAREKVLAQNPVDRVDCVSCYLWRVEGPYLALVVGLLFTGPGRYSLDAIVGSWL